MSVSSEYIEHLENRIKNLEEQYQQLKKTTVSISVEDMESTWKDTKEEIFKRLNALENSTGEVEKQQRELEATLIAQWNQILGMLQNTISGDSVKEMLDQERHLTETWVKAFLSSELNLSSKETRDTAPLPDYSPSAEHLNDLRTMIELLHDLCRTSLSYGSVSSCRCDQEQPVQPRFQRTAPKPATKKTSNEPEEKPYWMSEEEDRQQREQIDNIVELLQSLKTAASMNTPMDEFWKNLSEQAQEFLVSSLTEDPNLTILQSNLSLTSAGREWLSGLYSYVKLLVEMTEQNKNDEPF